MKRSTDLIRFESGVSAAGDEMTGIYVTTENDHRKAVWFNLFGVTRLPVKSEAPRWQEIIKDRQPRTVLAFDLDTDRLPAHARARAGAYLGTGSHPIPALGCEVVVYADETAESVRWQKRPFSFLGAETGATHSYA